jgi:hypothetical protein
MGTSTAAVDVVLVLVDGVVAAVEVVVLVVVVGVEDETAS